MNNAPASMTGRGFSCFLRGEKHVCHKTRLALEEQLVKRPHMTAEEAALLQHLRAEGSQTISQIVNSGNGWNWASTQSRLYRLMKMGEVERTKDGRSYLYRTKGGQPESLDGIFIDRKTR